MRRALLHRPRANQVNIISVRLTDEDLEGLNEMIDKLQEPASNIIRTALTSYWLQVMPDTEKDQ